MGSVKRWKITVPIKLSLISFLVGSIIMGYELTVSRLIAPYFGNSVFIWGILLSVVMAALATGYFLGGTVIDSTKAHAQALGAALLLSGFVLFSSYFVGGYLLKQSVTITTAAGSAFLYVVVFGAACVFAFAPAMILLGMVSPMLVKLATRSLSLIGNTAGWLSMVGSVGGIVGSLFAAFFCIPILGVYHSVQLFSIVLSASSLLVLADVRYLKAVFVFILFSLAGTQLSDVFLPRRDAFLTFESLYNHIELSRANDRLMLSTGNARGVQTISITESGVLHNYLDYLALTPALLNQEQPQSVLVIGVAGGTVIKQLNRFFPGKVSVDAVEIDQTMIDVAREYFDLRDAEANIIVGEGRQYVATTDKKYDVVLVDAFSTDLYAPQQLLTAEFFEQIKSVLTPNGILTINVVSPEYVETGESLYQAIAATVGSVFPVVYHAPLSESQTRIANHVLFASTSDFRSEADQVSFANTEITSVYGGLLDKLKPVSNAKTAQILTDDKSPVEYLYWRMLDK